MKNFLSISFLCSMTLCSWPKEEKYWETWEKEANFYEGIEEDLSTNEF